MADDDLTIRLRAVGARPFKRDVDRSARSLDNFGDQAGQAARKLARLNAASTKTRISLGPFSTSARGTAVAIGGLAIATGKAASGLLGLAEATATAAGGAGAAGGVGLTALAQGMGTVKLATAGLTDALGGNEDALAKLNPAQAKFVQKLQTMAPLLDKLRSSASGGLLGGAGKGLTSASRNFGVLNKIVRNTSGTLGGLAATAGKGLGSKKAGQDLASIGATNVKIIDNLGHATLSLAVATGDVLVEAGPLADWLSEMAKRGAALTQEWVANARASGRMADFFRRARTDLALLGSITGHGAAGLVNLFGAQDVDGTKTLANLDSIVRRFEAWTKSPAVKAGLGQALIDEIPQAAGAVGGALAKLMGSAAPLAADLFLKSFFAADAWGKALIGGVLAKKLGLFKLLGKGGPLGKGGAGLLGNKPVPVFVTNPGFAGGKGGIGGKLKGAAKIGAGGLAGGVAGGSALAAGAATSLLAPIGLGLWARHAAAGRRKAGATPIGDRNAASRGSLLPRSNVPLDAQGFPTGGIPKRPAAKSINLFEGLVTRVPVYIDGRQVAEAVHRHNAKEKARH